MRDITIAITAASYSGNKGAAAMLQSSISQLRRQYGDRLNIYLMSVYPVQDRQQCPHDFVKIIPAQPQRVLFHAFPCAVLYRLFFWCAPVRKLLLKNRMLKAYRDTDLVVDEAGIAFVDSRGVVMNTYAFACAAIPLLLGVPVMKYSQALGPFENWYNRLLAGIVLPKLELILARGSVTYRHLCGLGLKNVRLCADGAFTMPDSKEAETAAVQNADFLYEKKGRRGIVGLSISSVVAKRCKKAGIDYTGIMAEFIDWLSARGYSVLMFANAARMDSVKRRNNDLPVGDEIFFSYERKRGLSGENIRGFLSRRDSGSGACFVNGLCWERREMDAEEVRAYIGQCSLLVVSRFHAMVFALTRQVPPMIIGWSHKYQEVMDMFGLGEYAVDFSSLGLDGLRQGFQKLEENQDRIREKIALHLPDVLDSSRENVDSIKKVLDGLKPKPDWMNGVIDLNAPDDYLGEYLSCRMGYASDGEIRANAASGGLVTALLCGMLKKKEIDGAWVVRTCFTPQGNISYKAYIATTEQEIRDASSSVYLSVPMMSHIDELRRFPGRLAVVLTPCMMRAFCHILEKDDALRERIVLKIGLFCSGGYSAQATEYAIDKSRVPRQGAERLYYRRGHWRGKSSIVYQDGSTRDFSYKKTVCAYKNAYFFVNRCCLACRDQYAREADISFGDVWLKEVKRESVKYTGCVIRTREAGSYLERAAAQGDIVLRHMSARDMLRCQKRALTFKYRGRRLRHRLAGWLAERDRDFSVRHPEMLKKIPMWLVYYYMCMIRVLLS